MPVEKRDVELEAHLERKRQNGLVDFKCHVEVTENTDLNAVKAALCSVFDLVEMGGYTDYPANKLGSFDELMGKAGII